MTGSPSGPDAFCAAISNKAFFISWGVGVVHISVFSSFEMLGLIKFSKSARKSTSSYVKTCLKFSKKNSLIYFFSIIHGPDCFLIALIEFLLLLIIVERWKNLEFLSPSLSQISLDFCFHTISSLSSHSWSLACRLASIMRLASVHSLC